MGQMCDVCNLLTWTCGCKEILLHAFFLTSEFRGDNWIMRLCVLLFFIILFLQREYKPCILDKSEAFLAGMDESLQVTLIEASFSISGSCCWEIHDTWSLHCSSVSNLKETDLMKCSLEANTALLGEFVKDNCPWATLSRRMISYDPNHGPIFI